MLQPKAALAEQARPCHTPAIPKPGVSSPVMHAGQAARREAAQEAGGGAREAGGREAAAAKGGAHGTPAVSGGPRVRALAARRSTGCGCGCCC